ncbi:hypothetical protein [Massilia sp. CFBP9026]|uniref:hypothetical protein n=1 Tax=Massilia sp. CFBP9026 TaxID=3096536 RepID=UPI002A6A8B5C|nr:hypothetical protein [Massilia sp. CFBP9026]MDY0965431.1 hypothetical protein [Massilia sp. CFBP9026]
MAITTFLDPTKLPFRTQEQKVFDLFMAEFMRLLPVFGGEINAALGAFNAIAAGGAYALPYIFDTATADSDPGAGRLRLSSAAQNTSAVIRLDLVAAGQDRTTLLDTFDASTSTVKGSLRLIKQGDLSKWMTFDVVGRAAPAGYRNIAVVCTGSSSASPFAQNESLLLFFQRTGDRGEDGYSGYMKVSDRKGAAVHGGSASPGTNIRTLNTVDWNGITGASLAGNQVTLPAGTYEVFGRAPGFLVRGHQLMLRNVTDAQLIVHGSTTVAHPTYAIQTDSIITGRFSISSAKAFRLDHYVEEAMASYGLGQAANQVSSVYAELIFKKVA